jgi:predicted transcriptional regulator
MQCIAHTIEHMLSLINLSKQDLEVCQQLVEEVRDVEDGELAKSIAKL